ncbi:hypothetical protein CEXT_14221 [Caerostris extrusa]|uniref:Uncharacterized protein n=1 Tax=Caerostris extrusa TaxID=172846 RepID=A0AAV4MIR7_CAEEX|nr:hypothetical protein CEXT_14221 [Caerostris extrusa]
MSEAISFPGWGRIETTRRQARPGNRNPLLVLGFRLQTVMSSVAISLPGWELKRHAKARPGNRKSVIGFGVNADASGFLNRFNTVRESKILTQKKDLN